MKASALTFLLIQAAFGFALADDATVMPDWAKWPLFFVGAAVLASVAWFVLCCACCPGGCILKMCLVGLVLAAIGVWAYFMFGPWWTQVNTKSVSGLLLL